MSVWQACATVLLKFELPNCLSVRGTMLPGRSRMGKRHTGTTTSTAAQLVRSLHSYTGSSRMAVSWGNSMAVFCCQAMPHAGHHHCVRQSLMWCTREPTSMARASRLAAAAAAAMVAAVAAAASVAVAAA